jgi:hypothetical protein
MGISSKFDPDTDTVDDDTTLFAGSIVAVSSIELTAELSDTEEEIFYVNEANGAPPKGYAFIENEIIKYSQQFGHYEVRFLERGYNGTTPAVHAVGTAVELVPDFYIPTSFREANVALQELVLELRDQITALEARVTDLETP